MRRRWWSLALIAASVAAPARAQVSDALKDRVNQLVAKLDAEKVEARDAAQKALVDLGPRIKSLLEEADKAGSAERKARLAKVREAFAKAEENTNLGASKITIKQKGVRLSEAIKLLQTQSGNTINDLREQEGVDVTNPALDLEIVDKPFFEALDLVAGEAGLAPSFFTGDGSIGLMGNAMPGAPQDDQADGRLQRPVPCPVQADQRRSGFRHRHGDVQRPVRAGLGAADPADAPGVQAG